MEEIREERGVVHIGVPFTSATIEAIGGATKDRGKNIFVLGMLCAVYRKGGQEEIWCIEWKIHEA